MQTQSSLASQLFWFFMSQLDGNQMQKYTRVCLSTKKAGFKIMQQVAYKCVSRLIPYVIKLC